MDQRRDHFCHQVRLSTLIGYAGNFDLPVGRLHDKVVCYYRSSRTCYGCALGVHLWCLSPDRCSYELPS